jgi:hypothetical protein
MLTSAPPDLGRQLLLMLGGRRSASPCTARKSLISRSFAPGRQDRAAAFTPRSASLGANFCGTAYEQWSKCIALRVDGVSRRRADAAGRRAATRVHRRLTNKGLADPDDAARSSSIAVLSFTYRLSATVRGPVLNGASRISACKTAWNSRAGRARGSVTRLASRTMVCRASPKLAAGGDHGSFGVAPAGREYVRRRNS